MQKHSGFMRALAICAVLLFGVMAAHGQDASTGSISGTVTDSTGAVVKGASVVLTNTDRNHVERTVTTSGGGFYTATGATAGQLHCDDHGCGVQDGDDHGDRAERERCADSEPCADPGQCR